MPRRAMGGLPGWWSRVAAGCALALAAGSVSALDVVEYYHADAVGNVRVLTGASGAVAERHDYLPFGEEWCGTAICGENRTPGQPRRFTGKERDAETGLDYFGARYYRANLGRFTTIDPQLNLRGASVNPQKWNRFAYALNNSLGYVDSDGREEYRIVYGQPGRVPHFVGSDFKRAAETKAADLRRQGHTATVYPIGNVADLEATLTTGEPVTEGFIYFGHGGPGGLYIGDAAPTVGDETNLTTWSMNADVSDTHVLGSHATVELNTCKAAKETDYYGQPFAQHVANWLGRNTTGFPSSMGFSGDPGGEPRPRAPKKGRAYLVPPKGTKSRTFFPLN